MIYSHAFSRARHERHVFASSSDWFIGLFTTVVIGQSNYFGFGFTTLEWKPLYHFDMNGSKPSPNSSYLQSIKSTTHFTDSINILQRLLVDLEQLCVAWMTFSKASTIPLPSSWFRRTQSSSWLRLNLVLRQQIPHSHQRFNMFKCCLV